MNMQLLESALHFNPFEGDFGSCGDRTLKNKIVKFRKPHVCHICDAETNVGETGRNLVEIFEGEIGSFCFCQECCVAMAKSVDGDDDGDDDCDEIDRRYELGNDRRQSKIDGEAA
ncbi:hypothetical protein NUK42_02105 [Aeromonas veronii]|uniref:hypothetical protein n=1 Tax=Aeromonas veronii TaxID=654 RepID=UPI00214DF215|nr:hypothetical protein [Aeromonas veronii]MCR3957543.1 hypothetical protein [Aeromonas veronii]